MPTMMGERADSRRKRLRLVEAARRAVAEKGLDVAAADIAARAEVGVGTLYRRFGSREALVQDVLVDGLAEVHAVAVEAMEDPDPWNGFEAFFLALAESQASNRGVSEFTSRHGDGYGEAVARQSGELQRAIDSLVRRAQEDGSLRADVAWQDIVLLSDPPADANGCLGVAVEAGHWRRTTRVTLDGLRTEAARSQPTSG
ncbi:MAG TPA: TetR/AcrR family transcriptional regulator [Solirubrobacterales bacterium]